MTEKSDEKLLEETKQGLVDRLMFDGYVEIAARVFVEKVIQYRDLVQGVIDLSFATGNPPPAADEGGEEG